METSFLGVLGGMGPLATADFLRKLVKKTPADVDQKHIPVLLYGDCTTPDRTASVIGQGPSPLPHLLAGIRFLAAQGARAICIPCNSAHCWYDEMQAASPAPLLHIVKASAAQIHRKNPNAARVGVLSTLGTHRMGIYHDTLTAIGYEVVTPTDHEFETLISPAIAMNKACKWAEAEPLYDEATQRLWDRGAEIVVLGCTEIPFGMERQYRANPMKFVDSNDALVDAALNFFIGAEAAPAAA
ncbi:MAG: amino acid racemase [Proteobacteria bacterium]|nr:amino acid racemase [Pseudomonadota bacterium]